MRELSCLSIASDDGKQHLIRVVWLVLSSDFHCTPWLCTTASKNHQRVLQGCPREAMWCSAAQETGVVVNRQLAPPSRKCSSTFLALDSDFFRQKPDSCISSDYILSWYESLRLLAVPVQRSDTSYNENLTRALNAISPKCCLPSTDTIKRRGKNTQAYEGWR